VLEDVFKTGLEKVASPTGATVTVWVRNQLIVFRDKNRG